MINKFDYAEPNCPLCDGKDFYYPDKDGPLGRIPVNRIIDKIDSLYGKNDYKEAHRLLLYWKQEAIVLKDKRGELEIENELIGYYRLQNEKAKGLETIERALILSKELGQTEMASGATILINCATAYKAFQMAEKGLPLYKKAEEIYLKELNKNDDRFGGLYNNMALAYVDLGMFSEAEEKYLQALEVMSKVVRGEAECAITYVNMAHMYEQFNHEEKILDCLSKAYELLQSKNLPHNGYYAFVLDKCAPSFRYFGNEEIYQMMKKEAEEIYARS